MANDPAALNFLVNELQSFGLAPFPAADSLAALNAIDVIPPDVFLMTLEEPDAAVYQTVLRFAVLKRARRAHIPVVAIVGQGGESWRRTWDARLDGVLDQPVRPELLYATLGRWLHLPPPAGLAPDAPLPPRFRHACVEVDLQEYERSLARQDRVHMAHFAHRAKGAALALHADEAAQLADRLERAAQGYAPLAPEGIQHTLAALKAAVARHFEQEADAGSER
jgi:DNA-binding response OmpR family regulator